MEVYTPDIDQAFLHYTEQARLVRGKKDSVRLDWLESNLLSNPRKVHFVDVCGGIQFYSLDNKLVGTGKDLRGAVDSALQPIPTTISSYRLNDGTLGGTAHKCAGNSGERATHPDARRLNWIEQNPDVMIRRFATPSPSLHFQIDSADGHTLSAGADLRTALDVAMIISADEVHNDLPARNSRDELAAALRAILAEVSGPKRPYSADSYLPQHLAEAAHDALAKAGAL